MEKYIAAYESWRDEQDRGMEESEFKALESNLDGSYWANKFSLNNFATSGSGTL